MKSLGNFKDLTVPLYGGALDGRLPAGEGAPADFRILLNVDTMEQRGCARLPGMLAWKTDDRSNEDLHDQLLEAQGSIVDDVFVTANGQREVITLLSEVVSSAGTSYTIAGTKSRLYVSTGQGKNWRIVADGLGGSFVEGESPWPNIRLQVAQVGDFLIFTNGINPAFAWPIGGAVITTGDNANRRWAAFEIPDLIGLEINRVGVIASWQGFTFAGDPTLAGTRYPGRVYWSNENNPFDWAPGGESLGGYVDLGGGETILRIETIGGQLRIYTDEAIYRVELVGGDAVFSFVEIYRGDLALAFQWSLVNTGDEHVWFVQDSIVVLGPYDRVPNRYEWMHRAAGFIFKGLDGRLLADCPVPFSGFNPIDKSKCHQIAAGHDDTLGNIWFSWPTKRTSEETDDDLTDFEGTRRLTMVFNPRYNKATLVDQGFSAFNEISRHPWSTVRDFMVEQGVCSGAALLSDATLLGQKEGFPLNTLEAPSVPPTCIWNHGEDPNQPMSDDSVAAQVCDVKLVITCKQCVPTPQFAMVSTTDFCIKAFDISSRLREVYLPQQSTVWIPENDPHFPNVAQAAYRQDGYPTLIQGESSEWGTSSEKIITRILANYDAEDQTVPGKVMTQIGVSNNPHCMDWHDAPAVKLDCLSGDLSSGKARSVRPALFPFYRVGSWIAYRVFVTDANANYAPKGCGVAFNSLQIRAKNRNETWANQ